MKRPNSKAAQLAALLLLQEGELSIGDIEAIPLVPDVESAEAIALSLVSLYDAEWKQRKTRRGSVTFWEDYIRLREPIGLTKRNMTGGVERTRSLTVLKEESVS